MPFRNTASSGRGSVKTGSKLNHAAFTVNRMPTLFCNTWRIAKKFAVLGLPLGPSMRWRLLLGFFKSAASLSNPMVALTTSRKTAFPVPSSP